VGRRWPGRAEQAKLTSPAESSPSLTCSGLYDPRMGPVDHGPRCPTCGLGFDSCPGHLGVIALPAPVYHPLLFPYMYTLLRSKCFCCHHFRTAAAASRMLRCQLLLLDCGEVARAMALRSELQSVARATDEEKGADASEIVARQAAVMDAIERECVSILSGSAALVVAQGGLSPSNVDARAAANAEHGRALQTLVAASETGALGKALRGEEDSEAKEGEVTTGQVREALAALSGEYQDAAPPPAAKAFRMAPVDAARSPHVRALRASLVDEFLKKQPPTCANCRAPTVGLRKDGVSRLFLKPLTSKAVAAMRGLGLTYASAIAESLLGARPSSSSSSAQGDDSEEEGIAPSDEVSLYPELDDGADDGADQASRGDRLLAPAEAQAQLRALWRREGALCSLVWSPCVSPRTARHSPGWKAFFFTTLPVAPNRFRPPTVLGELKFEHPQTTALSKVLALSERYRVLQAGRDPTEEARQALERQRQEERRARKLQRLAARGLGSSETVEKEEEESDGAEEEAVAGEVAPGGPVDMGRLLAVWQQITDAVHGYIDQTRARERDAPAGLRQLLEKKEGLFRKHMMGKRVNYAARSVISPDPFIRTDQIGVPVRFAKRLSFPQAVAPFNAAKLASYVENGPDVYPGALAVEDENGRITDLAVMTPEQRRAIARTLTAPSVDDTQTAADIAMAAASSLEGGPPSRRGRLMNKPKKVWRHLEDGDFVLMNRQPTLHKPSIMAHRVRVLRSEHQQTLRMHYANCKTYNADFDGDEMNMHLPQDHLARAEAAQIAATPFQFVVPTTGHPIRGLIQDHISVGTLLTRRDMIFDKDMYMQLVWDAVTVLPRVGEYATGAQAPPGTDIVESELSATVQRAIQDGTFDERLISKLGFSPNAPTRDVPLVEPAILLPRHRGGKRLYTGKQVVSTLFRALLGPTAAFAVTTKAKLASSVWCAQGFKPVKDMPSDDKVVVCQSEMCTGVLDKSSLGNASFGLIHCVYELYGPQTAASLLSAFGRLLTAMLQRSAISCGLADLVLTPDADAARVARIRQTYHEGARAAARFAGVESSVDDGSPDASVKAAAAPSASWLSPPSISLAKTRTTRVHLRNRLRGGEARDPAAATRLGAELDNVVKASVSDGHGAVIRQSLPDGLMRAFPENFFALMVESGAKGTKVNHAMISCGLGQQELEGRRVPVMVSGRTLPSFPPYDPSPRAGGFVADRFLTGLRPQEYYFHCMSGREGLVDTAVKTSRSGYLQRCLVKHLEELTVAYDHSVRDAEGCIVQFLYGEDGMDVTRSAFLDAGESQMAVLARNCGALARQNQRAAQAVVESAGGASIVEGTMEIERALGVEAALGRCVELCEALADRRDSEETPAALTVAEAKDYAIKVASVLKEGDVVEMRCPLPTAQDPIGASWAGAAHMSGIWVRARVLKIRVEKRDPLAAPTLGEVVDSSFDHGCVATAVAQVSGLLDLEFYPIGKHSGSVKTKKFPLVDGFAGPLVRPLPVDPVLSRSGPSSTAGVLSERLFQQVTSFREKHIHDDSQAEEFDLMMRIKSQRCLADPGEPVGVLAAQSVGEPSTQMTLNTFHLAGHGGVNVTLGIPRLREIVMTASSNIKTPTMTLPLRTPRSDTAEKDARRIAGSLDKVSLEALLDVGRKDGGIRVVEKLRPETMPQWAGEAVYPGATWVREYRIQLMLAPVAAIRKEFGLKFAEIGMAAGREFVPTLLTEISKALKRAGEADLRSAKATARAAADAASVGDDGDNHDGESGDKAPAMDDNDEESGPRPGKVRAGFEEDEEDDDEEEEGSGDREGAEEGTLLVGRRKEIDGYDDDEDEDKDAEADDEEPPKEGSGSASSSSEDSDSDDDLEQPKDNGNGLGTTAARPRDSRAGLVGMEVPSGVASHPRFLALRGDVATGMLEVSLAFPASTRKILMLGVAETAARSSVVRQTPRVARAVAIQTRLEQGKEEEWVVQLEGVNLPAVWELSSGSKRGSDAYLIELQGKLRHAGELDAARIRTNDISAILSMYGVEAARAAIVREISAVFAVYGIAVDVRHLGLIADYMTHEGGFRPLSRLGMSSSASPLLRMSFESTVKFLTEAAMFGMNDSVKGASGRLVVGAPVLGGTGSFALRQSVTL
jgi:DNA-directed RNA polymerase beta' subunit